MYTTNPTPCTITRIANAWKRIKNRAEHKTTIKLVLQLTEELATSLGDDAIRALAALQEASSSVQVRFGLAWSESILELHDMEDGDLATVRMLDALKAVARHGDDGPELEVSAAWRRAGEDDDTYHDVLDFLHRHMGPLGVRLEARQADLPGIDGEVKASIGRLRRGLGQDGSVSMKHDGKIATLKGV